MMFASNYRKPPRDTCMKTGASGSKRMLPLDFEAEKSR